MKECISCHESKAVEEFHKDFRRKDGRIPYCKLCKRQMSAEYYQENQEKIKRQTLAWYEENKLSVNLSRFKMSVERYQELMEEQRGLCALCGGEETETWNGTDIKRLSVDHDHSCCSGRLLCGNCNRGLLCSRCNVTLGKVNDSTELLNRMVEYLNAF
jgi:hypothetical protein